MIEVGYKLDELLVAEALIRAHVLFDLLIEI